MKCEEKIFTRGLNFNKFRRCKNEAVVERNGVQYCRIHDPVYKEKKEKDKEIIKKDKESYSKVLYYSKFIKKI